MLIFRFGWVCLTALFLYSCGNNDQAQVTASRNAETATPDSVFTQLIAEDFVSPVYLTQPSNDERLFVVDQTGQIYIIKWGQKLASPFLDIKSKLVQLKREHEERGLLGLAFHPEYTKNGKFYVYYSAPLRTSAPGGWDCTSTISEFRVSASSPDLADTASERILLQIDKPQDNHNGGTLASGPDGYLYISIGDGGGAGDKGKGHVQDWYRQNEGGNGQDIRQNLLGSILRIDVSHGIPYGIPADNPFAQNRIGLPEIFAYGLRNPYRFCFAPDGSLIAADAGQELYEEVNVITKGGNYGWNIKEGRGCFDAGNYKQPLDSCPDRDSLENNLIDPVLEFKNTMSFPDGLGIVSVGGVVYNGSRVEGLKNKYLFGVWTQHHGKPDGALFAAERTANLWTYNKLGFAYRSQQELGQYVLGFGQDNNGEAYLLTTIENGPKGRSGKVYRME